MEGGGGKSWREGEGSHGGRGSGGVGQWEWGKREGVRGQGGVRERGGGEVHSSFVGTHRPWARIGRGWGVSVVGTYRVWARMGRGRVWVVGGVVVGCGRSSCVGEGLSCPWALVICGGGSLSSMGGALSSMRDGRLWVVGRGVVVVPGRCL